MTTCLRNAFKINFSKPKRKQVDWCDVGCSESRFVVGHSVSTATRSSGSISNCTESCESRFSSEPFSHFGADAVVGAIQVCLSMRVVGPELGLG